MSGANTRAAQRRVIAFGVPIGLTSGVVDLHQSAFWVRFPAFRIEWSMAGMGSGITVLQQRSLAGPLYHHIAVAVAAVPKMPALCHSTKSLPR